MRNNNYLNNKKVYANIDGEKVLVKVIDINNDNSLRVQYENKIYNLTSGEVFTKN